MQLDIPRFLKVFGTSIPDGPGAVNTDGSIRCRCPLHQDPDGSMSALRTPSGEARFECVSPKCGFRGDAVSLVSVSRGIPVSAAIELFRPGGELSVALSEPLGEAEAGAYVDRSEAQAAVMAELRRSFRPEFLNRLDETILFRPLTRENLDGIIEIMIEGLRKRLADQSLKLELTDAAKALIIERGYDPLYGARPLRRMLQSSVETLIARTILRGDLSAGATITVDVQDGELVCR